MSSSKKTFWTETLPDPLPANPLEIAGPMAGAGAARRRAAQSQFHGAGHGRRPRLPVGAGRALQGNRTRSRAIILFYTNYRSRKGRELAANPRAAVVFHWDHLHRQVRAEGQVELLSDAENDAYFRTRAWQSRSAPGRASKASRWNRGEALAAAVAARRAASAFPTRAPASQEPESMSPLRCRGRPTGADTDSTSMPWNCGSKGSSAFTTGRASRGPLATSRTNPGSAVGIDPIAALNLSSRRAHVYWFFSELTAWLSVHSPKKCSRCA